MKRSGKLALKRETLSELAATQLGSVVGANNEIVGEILALVQASGVSVGATSCVTYTCPSNTITQYCTRIVYICV